MLFSAVLPSYGSDEDDVETSKTTPQKQTGLSFQSFITQMKGIQ